MTASDDGMARGEPVQEDSFIERLHQRELWLERTKRHLDIAWGIASAFLPLGIVGQALLASCWYGGHENSNAALECAIPAFLCLVMLIVASATLPFCAIVRGKWVFWLFAAVALFASIVSTPFVYELVRAIPRSLTTSCRQRKRHHTTLIP